jgi:hypothetical protein
MGQPALMNDRQFLSSEDRGVVDSDDDSLPSLREILPRPKLVIDLTLDTCCAEYEPVHRLAFRARMLALSEAWKDQRSV